MSTRTLTILRLVTTVSVVALLIPAFWVQALHAAYALTPSEVGGEQSGHTVDLTELNIAAPVASSGGPSVTGTAGTMPANSAVTFTLTGTYPSQSSFTVRAPVTALSASVASSDSHRHKRNNSTQAIPQYVLDTIKLIAHLQIHPEPRSRAKVAG